MLIQRAADIPSSEITPESVYQNRREFMITAAAFLVQAKRGAYDTSERVTPYEYATTYNNFYEFGTDKADPAKHSEKFVTKPWTISVEGLVKKPAMYDLDDLIKGLTLEDRIYRMRCVEAWSMVIPWRGFPLAELIKRLEPAPSARYVEFKTVVAKDQMPGQRNRFFGGGLNWPYNEGLRLDEAMNPLTLFVTGVYGKSLPNQNGAPMRLITPWKYGFKGIKSIVTVRFTDTQPVSSWMEAWPQAYGFYANVNPNVDHPRWSQAREDRLGESKLSIFGGGGKRATLMFNGYTEQVAHMYAGMDLRKNY